MNFLYIINFILKLTIALLAFVLIFFYERNPTIPSLMAVRAMNSFGTLILPIIKVLSVPGSICFREMYQLVGLFKQCQTNGFRALLRDIIDLKFIITIEIEISIEKTVCMFFGIGKMVNFYIEGRSDSV